ncbi:hypothetical protein SLA2020_522540 [Shorea laevis]
MITKNKTPIPQVFNPQTPDWSFAYSSDCTDSQPTRQQRLERSLNNVAFFFVRQCSFLFFIQIAVTNMTQKIIAANKNANGKGKRKTGKFIPVPTECSKCHQFVIDIEAHITLAKKGAVQPANDLVEDRKLGSNIFENRNAQLAVWAQTLKRRKRT